MLIVCPSCGIKYNVPASYLTKDRTLKCAGCGASWVVKAVPQTAAETADTPPAAPAQPPVEKPVVSQPDEQVATPEEPAKPQAESLPDTAAVSEEPPASSAASEQPKAPEETVSQPDHQPVAAASETDEAQAEAPATSVAPEAHPAPSVTESQSPKPEAPLPDEHSAVRQVEPVNTQEEQPATPPATTVETAEAGPSPVAGENSTSVPHEEPLQSEMPVQNEEQEIRQEQAAEPAEIPEPVAAVPDVPAEEVGQPDQTEEQKLVSESHSEAPPAEVQEPVAPPPSAEPDEEKFSTLSEPPANQHFSTRITPLQDKTQSNSQGAEASDDEYEKPFSFLDLPIEPTPVAPPVAEQAAPEKKVVYRSIWDDEPETPASQPTGFGTKPEEDPHEWREKDLDEHFSVENTGFTGAGYQDENLVESSDNRDHLKDTSGQPPAEHEAEAFRKHVEKSDEQTDDDAPSPAPQDNTFDDVITRLRAARNNPGGQESAHHHSSREVEQAETAPWVPVWDRVSEVEEEAPASAEEHHEGVWEHTEAPDEVVPSEHAETVEEAKVEEEPAVAPRHVTPAIDISSRLRNDVLKRVEHADEGRSSFFESPAFWRKAWIASGVGAVVVLAACTHWFGALRHLWPALNLL